MFGPFRDSLTVGGVAGLVGGLLFWWALQAQGMASTAPGLLGVMLSGVGVFVHLAASIALGAGFAAVSRYQPVGYSVSCSLLYGLLLWIVGPMTLGVLLDGRGPDWSLAEAGTAFPSLIGHLLYGGTVGLGFRVLADAVIRIPSGPAPAEADTLRKRGSSFWAAVSVE